jgi:hypothetical protein
MRVCCKQGSVDVVLSLRSFVMSNLLSSLSSFDLEELILDLWCDVSTLEGKMIKEVDAFDKVINEGFLSEIKMITKLIVSIKEEIRSRVRIK